jgi:hypothetical protein
MIFALLFLVVCVVWIFSNGMQANRKEGVHEKEGFSVNNEKIEILDIAYSSIVSSIFMSPLSTEPAAIDNIKFTKINIKDQFNVRKDVYIPEGWYMIRIKEYIEVAFEDKAYQKDGRRHPTRLPEM